MKKVIAIIIALAYIFCGASCKQAKDAFIEGALKKEVEKFNQGGSKMVDKDTRLDSLSVMPGKCLVYHYTTVTYTRDDLDSNALKKIMRPSIRKTIMEEKDMATLRNNEVTFRYTYYDKEGNYWFAITIRPKDYKAKEKQ